MDVHFSIGTPAGMFCAILRRIGGSCVTCCSHSVGRTLSNYVVARHMMYPLWCGDLNRGDWNAGMARMRRGSAYALLFRPSVYREPVKMILHLLMPTPSIINYRSHRTLSSLRDHILDSHRTPTEIQKMETMERCNLLPNNISFLWNI